MLKRLQELIAAGVLTCDEAGEYAEGIAESFDNSGLHKIADRYWNIAKAL